MGKEDRLKKVFICSPCRPRGETPKARERDWIGNINRARQAAPVKGEVQDPAPASDQTQTVTVDDITKIIVRKVKQDRTNNEKIGSILKTYGVARVSELPTAKYEAFLTDISQL